MILEFPCFNAKIRFRPSFLIFERLSGLRFIIDILYNLCPWDHVQDQICLDLCSGRTEFLFFSTYPALGPGVDKWIRVRFPCVTRSKDEFEFWHCLKSILFLSLRIHYLSDAVHLCNYFCTSTPNQSTSHPLPTTLCFPSIDSFKPLFTDRYLCIPLGVNKC